MSVVTINGSPFEGTRLTAWVEATIQADDVLYILSDEPLVLAGVSWDATHDATTATLQLDPTENETPESGDWRTVNMGGSPVTLTVTPGEITGLSYSDGYLLERAALKLDAAETATRTVRLLFWRAS